jgi:hypothetical protein
VVVVVDVVDVVVVVAAPPTPVVGPLVGPLVVLFVLPSWQAKVAANGVTQAIAMINCLDIAS